jgi:hypothetical protein
MRVRSESESESKGAGGGARSTRAVFCRPLGNLVPLFPAYQDLRSGLLSVAPPGLIPFFLLTHGLRRGLGSAAASRLELSRAPFAALKRRSSTVGSAFGMPEGIP